VDHVPRCWQLLYSLKRLKVQVPIVLQFVLILFRQQLAIVSDSHEVQNYEQFVDLVDQADVLVIGMNGSKQETELERFVLTDSRSFEYLLARSMGSGSTDRREKVAWLTSDLPYRSRVRFWKSVIPNAPQEEAQILLGLARSTASVKEYTEADREELADMACAALPSAQGSKGRDLLQMLEVTGGKEHILALTRYVQSDVPVRDLKLAQRVIEKLKSKK